ncbi:NUDIX hydrolase [Agrobacterium larrymoorei]|uniref:NUDIX hydrolase n=1 Tax=Agrobacterium larrymoorei TaxID=160699 RepID=UPI0030C5C110
MRPRDAACLILTDRSGDYPRVLVGKRSSRHVFMPDVYVFPGGRRDPRDHALPFSADLRPRVIDKLRHSASRVMSVAGARALALAAVRELQEETGLCFQNDHSQQGPDLASLRYVARAITPPGRVRRFDTRFFFCFTDEVGIEPANIKDSAELQDLQWLDIRDSSGVNMAAITRMVLEDVTNFMIGDQPLHFESRVRLYFERRGTFIRGFL